MSGVALTNDPRSNKGTAFTRAERGAHALIGLLRHGIETLDHQLNRVLEHPAQKATDLERHMYLTGLLDRNETLFYRVVMSDPVRFLPIIYAPTVGEACVKFGSIYRRARGMYVTHDPKGRVADVLRNWPERDVRFICVSTGGRILGLGDIGANGMDVAIGKLQLYTACAGVPPHTLHPVLLDIGTSRASLRADSLYLGLRQEPPIGELDALIEEFVEAVQEVFPGCCIQFEDWKDDDAIRLLDCYADRVLCYNDDIQGTAAIALAGLTTALQITSAGLADLRLLFLGAGSAATGVAGLIVKAIQTTGLSADEARSRIAMFDKDGLIEVTSTDLSPAQRPSAHDMPPSTGLVETIESFKPTALFDLSTRGGAFDRRVVETMTALNPRPIIFALSNPTAKAECIAEQAYHWSKSTALFAAGVQFTDIKYDGRTFHPGQANNFYIFPAIGLATAERPPEIRPWIEAILYTPEYGHGTTEGIHP